jgi:uncharacterized repeat protein (TIGR01451 family)
MLVAMLVLMFGALPAMASEITLKKNTIPENAIGFRIGDTIHYELTVGNPISNGATNTLSVVEDILPNGSTVVLATNVVQAPGVSNTYYVDYVVDADDLVFSSGAWRVVNVLHIAGTDSLDDIINATTSKSTIIYQPAIDLEKLVNGLDADTPTGPMVPVGSTVTFTFVVTNTGDSTLAPVVVNDDVYGLIGTIPTLAPGASQTLTYTTPAMAGQHTNTATATGTPPTGAVVTDTDPGNYFGTAPAVDLEKHVNGSDADTPTGPMVPVGSTVTFTFIVTNTGNTALTNVVVTDDVYGVIGTIPTLAAGASQTLTKTATALAGQHTNIATVTTNEGATDTDPGNYYGEMPALATRTQGFWSTHTAFTSAVFAEYFPGGMNIGVAPHKGLITNIQAKGQSQLFGAWYASIPKMSNGTRRSALDKARIQMLGQLVAAKLNYAASGAIPSNPNLIAEADAAFGGTNVALILKLAGQLDMYNNSGDDIEFPEGLPSQGSATPMLSREYADIPFWNAP